MTAAELRGHYMADTLTAFKWLQAKFKEKKQPKQKQMHTVKGHSFWYVPQAGEGAEGGGVVAELKRKRQPEMVGAAGLNTMGHFDFRATGSVGSIKMRSRACVACCSGVRLIILFAAQVAVSFVRRMPARRLRWLRQGGRAQQRQRDRDVRRRREAQHRRSGGESADQRQDRGDAGGGGSRAGCGAVGGRR